MVCFTPEEAERAVRAYDGVTDQVILCSTVDVYHRPVDRMPVREDAPHEPGVSEYGRRKSACEGILLDAHDAGRFDVTVVRPWSTYGEGGGVHHTFGSDTYYLDRIRRGLPIVVHGDGTSVWGPCHRDDVAGAFVGAVGNEVAFGEAYHVTTDEAMTWNRYHRTVAEAMGAPEPTLVHVPTDVLRRVAPERTEMLEKHYRYSTVFDDSKAKAELGYEYTVPWREGVRRTVDWLEEHDRIRDAEEVPFDDRLIERWRSGIDAVVSDLADDQ
jgi:nucleoside-diphosphate-sugar epimerase